MAVLGQLGDDAAWRLARVAHAEHLTHLGQGQADRLGSRMKASRSAVSAPYSR